jgi:hypothetical protein
MPALKNPGLVVFDNAMLKQKIQCAHNFSLKKAVLQNYLTQHNIPFSATDTKKVLYKRLPLPEGIFGASDPSFGSHI